MQVDVRSGARHRAVRPPARRKAGLAALAASLLITAITVRASAATLGGVSGASLFAQVLPGPTQGVVDTFTGVGGSSLGGRVTDTGQTWTVSSGHSPSTPREQPPGAAPTTCCPPPGCRPR